MPRPTLLATALLAILVACVGCGHATNDEDTSAQTTPPKRGERPIEHSPTHATHATHDERTSAQTTPPVNQPLPPELPGPQKAARTWESVKTAQLKFTFNPDVNKPTRILEFPERDFDAEYKTMINSSLDLYAKGKVKESILRTKIIGKNTEAGLRQTFYLFSNREQIWPKDDLPLTMPIWGVRKSIDTPEKGPTVLFEIMLQGTQSRDGAFYGKATGRVSVGSQVSWLVFQDAEFELIPWTAKLDD